MKRTRIACGDEGEVQRVKEPAQKVVAMGARVLRDQLGAKVERIPYTANSQQ
jgi:hypothetical protein